MVLFFLILGSINNSWHGLRIQASVHTCPSNPPEAEKKEPGPLATSMMNIQHFLNILTIWFLGIMSSYACNCPVVRELAKIQKYEFENSECIFVGEVLEINKDNNTFKVKVIESFDETNSDTIYNGSYDPICGPSIKELGIWLFYGNFYGSSILQVNACGLTRSFSNPGYNLMASVEMPPFPDKGKSDEWIKERNKKAMLTLANELDGLRKRRNEPFANNAYNPPEHTQPE